MTTSLFPHLHRSTDPDTSVRAANMQTAARRTELQTLIERWASGKRNGFTDWELNAAFPADIPSTIRTRRSELVVAGVIADTGRRAAHPSRMGAGRLAIIWCHRRFLDNKPGA